MNQWCKLLAEYRIQVGWIQEKPESASGIGGATQPIGVVYVPVGLAGCNGVIRSIVVEQDVPPLLLVGTMSTLQVSLDRQFGGESSLRTLKSGHTTIRADQFDPDGWQLPETAELCQNNDQGFATNDMSAIALLHPKRRCTDDSSPAGDNDAASARTRRLQQKIPSDGNGTARSHPTTFPLFRNMSGIFGRSIEATNPGKAQRPGTFWTLKQWKRLAHYLLYVLCAAFFDTLARELLVLIPMGRPEDIQQAVRRRATRNEEQEK